MALRLPCGEQPQRDSKAASEVVMNTLKGAALIVALIGFIATCAMWIHSDFGATFARHIGSSFFLGRISLRGLAQDS
jgi:hypothetical protein